MRLINTKTLHLDEFHGSEVPPYAILSHTWTASELNLQDWLYAHSQNPPRWGWVHLESEVSKIKAAEGYRKVVRACDAALKDGLSWLWADTVCIDKTSSTELSEAINSMYGWYSLADVCYAFLEDVPPSTAEECSREESRFRASRWFTRGWTLQELLAPRNLWFMSSSWTPICKKGVVSAAIEQVTGIPPEFLSVAYSPQSAGEGISTMMAWACGRQTTREEDVAYSLMGLFGVNMPLLYGERRRAFRRLQLDILQTTTDWTFLAWDRPQTLTRKTEKERWVLEPVETLAVDPDDFHKRHGTYKAMASLKMQRGMSMRVGNLGLELRIALMGTPCSSLWFAVLPLSQQGGVIWMPLWGDVRRGFRRIAFPSIIFSVQRNEYILRLINAILPIYIERDVAAKAPMLQRPAVRLHISPVSVLFTWPIGDESWRIVKRFPDDGLQESDTIPPVWLDTAILRLRFDDVVERLAYGAIETKVGGFWAARHALFFAVEFESMDSLRPRRWMCSYLGIVQGCGELGAEATKKVRRLAENGLAQAEFPLDCSIGDWDVSLDYCAFDSPTKQYVLPYKPAPARPGPVDRAGDGRYEETFIVAQIGERRNLRRRSRVTPVISSLS